MNVRRLAATLRNHSFHALTGEAAWRGLRSSRQWLFRLTRNGGACPVRFQPLGYYRAQLAIVDEPARRTTIAYADSILRGEYPLMGYGSVPLGIRPDWHRDWVAQSSWPLQSSRSVRIVRHDGSDVKAPWELSRLQFAPVVAKAWLITGHATYRDALLALLADWVEKNPVGRGIHWTVAMEAALRGISLCLTMDLLWPFAPEEKPWVKTMTRSLWQHLRFIEAHSEFSFLVRSNHYLSNIVGLTTLSAYLQGPGMASRHRRYARAVDREILVQTYADGGNREASTGYHVLVAQMFLHAFAVQQRSGAAISPAFEARLRLMFAWIATVADDDWKLPHLGDCDNGRVELTVDDCVQAMRPPGKRTSLQVRSLCALAGHLLLPSLYGDRQGQNPVVLLPGSGIAVLRAGDASVVFCAMPNGLDGRGSHTHCDKLSLVFRLGADEVFCDSGSRCYTRSATLRNLDRSTRAHSTLTIDGAEQNTLDLDRRALFLSGDEASVSPITVMDEAAVQASHGGYRRFGVEHQRTVSISGRCMKIVDEVRGAGEHSLDLRFIPGPEWRVATDVVAGTKVRCHLEGSRHVSIECTAESALTLSVLAVEISREYGASTPTSALSIRCKASLPTTLQTRVTWD